MLKYSKITVCYEPMGFFDNLTSFVEHYLVSLVVLRDLRNYGKNKERSHFLDLIKTRVLWRGCHLTKKSADYSTFEHFQPMRILERVQPFCASFKY